MLKILIKFLKINSKIDIFYLSFTFEFSKIGIYFIVSFYFRLILKLSYNSLKLKLINIKLEVL